MARPVFIVDGSWTPFLKAQRTGAVSRSILLCSAAGCRWRGNRSRPRPSIR
jgi:hypothetical protein